MEQNLINVSDQSYSIQHCFDTPLKNKYVLNDDQWEELAKGLDHLGKIAVDNGMQIVYHHHMTTTVQKTGEIDRLMEMTDPRYVNLICDTVTSDIFRGRSSRNLKENILTELKHAHLKECQKICNGKCYAEDKSFLRSIPEACIYGAGRSRSVWLISQRSLRS